MVDRIKTKDREKVVLNRVHTRFIMIGPTLRDPVPSGLNAERRRLADRQFGWHRAASFESHTRTMQCKNMPDSENSVL